MLFQARCSYINEHLLKIWNICKFFFFFSKQKTFWETAKENFFFVQYCFVFNQKNLFWWGSTLWGFSMKNFDKMTMSRSSFCRYNLSKEWSKKKIFFIDHKTNVIISHYYHFAKKWKKKKQIWKKSFLKPIP